MVIKIEKFKSEDIGSCNGCRQNDLLKSYNVWKIEITRKHFGQSIRLCKKCLRALVREVKGEK